MLKLFDKPRSFIKRCGACLILLVSILGWAGQAHAQGFISQSAWLEDPTGTLAYSQLAAQAEAFKSYEDVLARGYTPSIYWIRLRIEPTQEEKLILRLRPTYIDHIELYDPVGQNGVVTPRFSGDRYPKQEDSYVSLNHGFAIAGSAQSRDIYLRVQSTSTILMYAEALTPGQTRKVDRQQELLYSLYCGLLIAFIVWALQQWLISKEVLIAAFLFKQTTVLLHALTILGYLPILFGEWLLPPFIDRLSSVLILVYVFSNALFMLLLLRGFKPVRWIWWSLVAALSVYALIIVLFIRGDIRQALQINMGFAALESIGVFSMSITARAWKDNTVADPPSLPRWVLISFNVIIILAVYSSVLPSFGLPMSVEWTLNAPMFGGFVSGLLMTLLLVLRAHNLEKNRLRALFHLHLAENNAKREKERREEQELFLSMLTHELKTPLSVARISLGAAKLIGPQRDRIDRALININAIVDRCRMTDQFEHAQLSLVMEDCDLLSLINGYIAVCSNPQRVLVTGIHSARVSTDTQLVGICLSNLIDNALKYSPPDSRVLVSLQPGFRAIDSNEDAADGNVCAGFNVEVISTIGAAGVPDETRLFCKYYRSPHAQSKSGSGLGLYLSRGMIRMLSGDISYRQKGDYLEFNLWIPTGTTA